MSHIRAAIATMNATRWELFLARLFGGKITATDAGCVLTMRRWRGKLYLTDYKEVKE